MDNRIQRTLVRVFITGALVAFLGCASVPRVCTVSPIDIEETLSDIRDLEVDRADAEQKLAKAKEDLAGWEERLAARRAEPPVLNAELERLKRASGRIEKAPEEESNPQQGTQAQQNQVRPATQREDG